MILRQRIATYGIATTAVATVALALWLKPWATQTLLDPPKPEPIEVSRHKVDVVFAVDTTGSMGGLIDGAKRTVWSIATHIRELDKDADLHVGLVAYRDLGDEYVTKDFALSSDMDAVFTELSSYQAGGGGDIPEDVDAALYDAVHKMQWREGAKKLVFLVGDAPPASRGEVPKFSDTVKVAASQQITVNTIRCGQDADTASQWQVIAKLGNGEFSSIQQDGGVQQIATPYDDKLAELSRTIDETTVVYGDEGARMGYARKMAAAEAAPPATKADRATFYAKPMGKKGGPAKRAAEDIVGDYAAGSANVDGMDANKLPEDMRGLSKDELKNELDKRVTQRAEAQKQLTELAKKRADFIRDHESTGGGGGFDTAVKSTVDRELAK
jgi:hypothetical protein